MKTSRILWLLGFIAVVAFAEPTSAPSKNAKDETAELEEEKKTWPKTVDEAVTRILSDTIVRGESSQEEDNPHSPTEQPSHTLYHLGARAAEGLLAQLKQS